MYLKKLSKNINFNSKIVIDKCQICGKETDDIHHIDEQNMADKDGYIEGFHKNSLFNLVQLCKECHMEVHHGGLKINGWIETNQGRE